MKRKTYLEIIAGLLVLLFIYAGLNKLLDYSTFKLQLGLSPLLASWAGIIAVVLPAGELLLAVLLVIPATRLLGYYLSFALLILFTGYLAYMLSFSAHLPCTCSGVISSMSWNQHVLFNSVFILLALAGILLYKKSNRPVNLTGLA